MSLSNVAAALDWKGGASPAADRCLAAQKLPNAQHSAVWSRGAASGPAVSLSASTVWNTFESTGPASPQVCPGELTIAADARIDNRQEVIALLGILPDERPDDAALIAEVYRRWDVDGFARLRGDFAFVLWDEARRRLVAVRDVFGTRGLAMSTRNERVVVASTIRGVLALSDGCPALNRRFLRRSIAGRPTTQASETAYEGVSWLLPGQVLIAERGGVSIRAFDTLVQSEVRVDSEPAAWEQFRALFDAAVQARLRGCTPVGLQLSGGFDSSAIAVVASRLARTNPGLPPIRTYSAIFTEEHPRADERGYLEDVLARCGNLIPARLPWNDYVWSLDRLGPADGFTMEEPPQSSRFMGVVLSRQAIGDGCRVMLSGLWGDQLLFRQPYFFGEFFWDLPLPRMASEWRRFARMAGLPRLATGGLRYIRRQMDQGVSATSAELSKRFVVGANAVGMTYTDRVSRTLGIEQRFPFLDRPLQEFVRGLPTAFFFKNGERKRLLRRALADDLPESFARRDTFAAVSHAYTGGMNRNRKQILALLEARDLVRENLMGSRELQQVMDCVERGVQSAHVAHIQRVAAMAIWLRHRDRTFTTGEEANV